MFPRILGTSYVGESGKRLRDDRLTYECSGVWQQWPQADEKVGWLDVTKPSYHPREDFLVSVEYAFLHKAGVEVIPLVTETSKLEAKVS